LDSIGIVTILEIPGDHTPGMPAMTGYGWPDTKPFFWLVDHGTVGTNMHLAFTVDTRDEVRTPAPRIAKRRRCARSTTPTSTTVALMVRRPVLRSGSVGRGLGVGVSSVTTRGRNQCLVGAAR